MSAEKVPRAYRSTLRAQQARETRERVIRAAGVVFSRQGYQAATMSAIAREAAVSTETVKATASKSDLLIAAFETIFAGAEGEASLADTPAGATITDLDAEGFVDAVVDAIALANEHGHALWTVLLGAALSDASVEHALQRILANRRADYARLVSELAARGAVFADPVRAAAELSFLLSPEGYQQFVVQSGWSRADYVAWLRAGVARTGAGSSE